MKKYILLFITLFFISISNVSALDEYNIKVSLNGEVSVTNAVTNESINDYSNIATVANGELVILENNHINFIYIGKEFKITSNDKKVYINQIYSDIDANLYIKDINSEDYESADKTIRHSNTVGDTTYGLYYGIASNDDLYIESSNMKFRSSISYEAISGMNIEIKDSVFETELRFYSLKNMTLKNTKIKQVASTKNASSIVSDEELVIDNCEIEQLNQNSFIQSLKNVDLKNSTLKLQLGIHSFMDLKLDDNTIYSRDNGSLISSDGKMNISNNTINFNHTNDEIYSKDNMTITNSDIVYEKGISSNKDIIIKESSITQDGVNQQYGYLYAFSNMTITNSDISTLGPNAYIQSNAKMNIKDSNIAFDFALRSVGDLEVNNSSISVKSKLTHQGYIQSMANITIDNSTITSTDDSWSESLNSTGNMTITDSIIDLGSTLLCKNNAYFKDSYIKVKRMAKSDMVALAGYDFSTESTLIVRNELKIENSRMNIQSEASVPAVLVLGSINIVDDNDVFKDNDNNILDITKVTVNNTNFLNNPNNYQNHYNSLYVSNGNEVYTLTLNGKETKNALMDAYYTVRLRVINGCWDNIEEDELEIKVLIGEEVDLNNYNNLKANEGYTKGSWKKIDDNNYVYEFEPKIVNPKTGVLNSIPILFISILLLYLLLKNKDKLTVYRKL